VAGWVRDPDGGLYESRPSASAQAGKQPASFKDFVYPNQ
jgi:hypothetical protein